KGKPMLEHDFTPLFKLAHMLKDVQLCLAEARTAGSAFPFAGLAAELYGAGMGRGLGDQDFAAVLEVVEGITGTRLYQFGAFPLCAKIRVSFVKLPFLQGSFVISRACA